MTVNVHQGNDDGLDRSRRYLRPVNRLNLPDQPDDTHWAVYKWLPAFDAWATGMALCGNSTTQGPLPAGTTVTCTACGERRPEYERYLAPGYKPEDDDPKALRARIAELEQQAADVRATALRQAVEVAEDEARHLYDDMGHKAFAGARLVVDRLRALADETSEEAGQ